MKNNIPNINELQTDSPECCMQEWVILYDEVPNISELFL